MHLGYNTNGLAHHRLSDAIALLAEEGFTSIALTLDAGCLDPYQDAGDLEREIASVRDRLDALGMMRVVETGARFLLNPRRKHDPNLMDPSPARRAIRREFLVRSLEIAQALDAPAISFWSGAYRPGSLENNAPEDVLMDRLVEEIRMLLPDAERTGRVLAFEPEPGMFLDTMDKFARLDESIAHPLFQLTLDLGHVHCLETANVADCVRAAGKRIANIHIEDMLPGVHEHLMFGEGTIDFPAVFAALADIGYEGCVNVELSRHSHNAVEAVQRSRAFLQPLLDAVSSSGPT